MTKTLLTGLLLLATVSCTALPGGVNTETDASALASVNTDSEANIEAKMTSPLDLVSFAGDSFTGEACDKEAELKSAKGATTRISFKNNSKDDINVYWLDFTGKRVPYKKDLKPGTTHSQGTFVTHPWVITDAKDQCIGIYTSKKAGAVTLSIDKSVDVSSVATVSAVTKDNLTVARFKQGLTCLESKGEDLSVRSLNIMLNLYNNGIGALGAEASAKAFLSPGISDINKAGC